MQTLERAMDRLRDARSVEGTAGILRELGFPTPPLPLDRAARDALAIPGAVVSAAIVPGVGCLRALVVELRSDADLRLTLTAVAHSLCSHAPQFLWIVCAIRPIAGELAIVCWSTDRSRSRLHSLVCRTANLYESDAETLCALSAAVDESDLLTHARWLDVLGREAITGKFFRTLKAVVEELASSLTGGTQTPIEAHELALLYVSRLIFLCFLETKGWLDGNFGFLSNGFAASVARGGRYQRRVLEPLFFGTLNTSVRQRASRAQSFGRIPFLNGGLFARSHLEKRCRSSVFSDEAFGNAYGSLLSRYRFSGREDSADWSEAAIDPEILGKAFESLMAAPDRKTSGAFYTPQALVEDLTRHTLASVLHETANPLTRLQRITVLDPACGSGSFLVYILERIAALRREYGESASMAALRRSVLTTSIFGVDLNPMAVWLCELRLWLSIVIETDDPDPMRIAPLPNLDRHIRVGDSLAGGTFDEHQHLRGGRKLAGMRSRYVRAIGPRKRMLARVLDRMERGAATEGAIRERVRLQADRKEIVFALRTRDLFGDRRQPDPAMRTYLTGIRSRLRELGRRIKALQAGGALPFSFAAHFSDVAADGGFDAVIGNPPWVRLHHIAPASRDRLRRDFAVYRNAAWQKGADIAGARHGFAAQVDLAALFVERSCDLLQPGGTLALILPAKLWQSLAGGGVRQLLVERTHLSLIEDLTESQSQFDAAVYPSLLIARRRLEGTEAFTPPITIARQRNHDTHRWRCPPQRLALDDTPGSPWLFLPPAARTAFDRITQSGTAFCQSMFGRPLLGVKTGHNAAYIVRVDSIEGELARITAGERKGLIEREMLRPLLRGETLAKWSSTCVREYLAWPHCSDGSPRRVLPPLARSWLMPFRDALSRRSDLHGRTPWWSLFRTESARHDLARVVWADFGLTPRAAVFEPGDPFVALNSCYTVSCPTLTDAHALAALLNGPIAASWLNAIAEPARGGYRRYLGWTMGLLPIPHDWHRASDILAPLGERAVTGELPGDGELLDAGIDAYQLDPGAVEPLLSWRTDCD
ncbi:MAG: Eco57I restriction-modification methylase domain-containing protein [Gemmatimonadaceae bacterium]